MPMLLMLLVSLINAKKKKNKVSSLILSPPILPSLPSPFRVPSPHFAPAMWSGDSPYRDVVC